MENDNSNPIIFYGTRWCWQCRQSQSILQNAGKDLIYIDIDENEEAAQKVMEMNRGFRSVPTIIFPDGTHLVEPSANELVEKLNSSSTEG